MALVGYARTCGVQSGGGMKVWLTEVASVTSFTFATSQYTAITMNASAVFKVYEFDWDTCEVTEDVEVTNNCMKVVHGLNFYLTRMSSVARAAVEEIALASSCGLIAVVQDNNGTMWVLGYSENHKKLRPMLLKSAKGSSGKKLNDANGYTITLENENNEMMRICTATPVIV